MRFASALVRGLVLASARIYKNDEVGAEGVVVFRVVVFGGVECCGIVSRRKSRHAFIGCFLVFANQFR